MIRKPNFKLNWRYALGEIALIFIGISLAIAFDNWNENRKERLQLEGYLKTIEKNIQADTVEIDLMQRRYVRYNEYALKFIEMIFNDQIDEETIGNTMNLLAERYIIIDQTGFESLKNSGSIKDLQGTPLEDALFGYYNAFENTLQQEQSLNNFIETLEAKLFDMDSKLIVDVLRWGLNVDIADKGKSKIPKEEMLKLLASNSHLIGIVQRMADEDSPRYSDMKKRAELALQLIHEELNN